MPLFRSRPTVVDAEQWFPGNGCRGVRDDHPDDPAEPRRLCGCILVGGEHAGRPHVHPTRLSSVLVQPGDWIIREPEGPPEHFYPCRDEVFRTKYEPA